MVGQNLSILTDKPQTTRQRILGIVSSEEYQNIITVVIVLCYGWSCFCLYSGLADGLIGGSLIGVAGELPSRYMEAVFAGTGSSACLHEPRWLRSEVPVIILTSLLGLSNGVFTSVLMILAPKSVSTVEAKMAGIVMALFLR